MKKLIIIGAALLLTAAGPAQAASTANGQQVYQKYCASCHGAGGQGEMAGTPDFTLNERLIRPDAFIMKDIKQGKNAMPAFQGMLTDEEILDVIAYLRTFAFY